MSDDTTPARLQRPAQAKVPLARILRELPVLATAGPARALDIARATAELAFARVLLARRTVRQLGIPDLSPAPSLPLQPDHRQRADIARISKAIAIAVPRVPWRSDCLVQCLAGRRWLAALGIPARIQIGVKRETRDGLDDALLAHAWLSVGEVVVTGGDIADFAAFGDRPQP
ncbi:MAG: lasso peptide biosynthesis B2 protein [Novosphingobium sp.]|uniref:lasso peptide biosynthesis B2 protein n=1 Tax=Novosphingobium sp. TaxID=1874826 RepID=UPI003B991C2E